MRRTFLPALSLGFLVFIFSNQSYSQATGNSAEVKEDVVVGKLFTKAEADSLFGQVLKAYAVKTEYMKKFTVKSPKQLMFRFVKGKALILDALRKPLSDTTSIVDPNDEFRLLSTSKLLELMEKGGSDTTTVEVRESALTITNGETVLERSFPCPPHCEP